MGPIEKTIEEFRQKRLAVYKADPEQVVRDSRSAERAAKDHVGRWLFEVLQNSDDAKASKVQVLVEDAAVYVADNGFGLKPKAVSAICGTDFSDKTTGTIGRKGVGFKSVYEISANPQVLTVNGEGIEFCQDKARKWLKENGLQNHSVPHQWIPFFVSWDEAKQKDPVLSKLGEYKTVVRLREVSSEQKQKVEQILREWPPHALFAFRHLREIQAAPILEIVLTAGGIQDSRSHTPPQWRVAKNNEPVPEEVTRSLGEDERRAIEQDGVGILVGAPLEDGCTVAIEDYLPIHVFYPTEQKGPVRLLLHAEFLVKSDRTALIPIEDSSFNSWVADKLASHVCEFVNGAYRSENPSRHAALLMPFEDRASHPVAQAIWNRIAEEAKAHLRLADVDGNQRLTVGEGQLLSVGVDIERARQILKATEIKQHLLHQTFDHDKDARKTLEALGFQKIDDQKLIKVIADHVQAKAADLEWLWICWEWFAAWLAEKPYGDDRKQRIEIAKSIPIIPVDGCMHRPDDLAGRIVTWRLNKQADNFPDWLPLTFVDDWFRDRVQGLPRRSGTSDQPVSKLLEELGIEKPGDNVVQQAVGQAIEQYWKDKQGEPGRFLHLILEQDWHETSAPSPNLQRCPVAARRGDQNLEWVGASAAYFGADYGNDLLAELYEGNTDVSWVVPRGSIPVETQRPVLEWLGVANCPRILQDDSHEATKAEKARVRPLVGYNSVLKAEVLHLDRVNPGSLSPQKSRSLLTLFALNWEKYYRNKSTITVEYTPRSRSYYKCDVPAAWWDKVQSECIPPPKENSSTPYALKNCWLPDKHTERAIGDLLPVIDLAAFGDDKELVRDWLVNTVRLRTRIDQVTLEEWEEFLSKRIPNKVPVSVAKQLWDKVTKWYEVCLDAVIERDDISEERFKYCLLLCRKGDLYQYVADEPRYLADDNDLAKAFAQDVWLFDIQSRLTTPAVKYFGVLSLSRSVQVHVEPEEPKSPLSDELRVRFNESLPYIWAWRSSRSKQDRQDSDKLSSRLKALNVYLVPDLKAHLELNGISHIVERSWDTADDALFLHKDHANESSLSLALAKAIAVRTEADFYENLLRCNYGEQRKEKLLTKGMSEAEVERCLREYSGRTEPERPNEQETQASSGPAPKSPSPVPTSPVAPGKEPQQPSSSELPHSTVEPPARQKPLALKDPNAVDYVVSSTTVTATSHGGGGGGGGGEPSQTSSALSEEQKAEIEKRGRTFARLELEKMGYEVEEMPLHNPGFDIKAAQDGRCELRIEVKAHLGRASVVELTIREYEEYLKKGGEYDWQLWNIEHLEQSELHATITKYTFISDEAIEAKTFRVDLRMCE